MAWFAQRRIDWLEWSAAALRRAAQLYGGAANGPAHLATGLEGETAGFFYLRRKGYTVVARRWSSGLQRGDVDLIAWQNELLCFIEVKTRTAHDLVAAEVAVDSNKRNTLRKLARAYMRQLPGSQMPAARFDILSVYLVPGQPKELVHFEAAFGWSDAQEYELR
jgi:putative endonuclease